jgi:uncharacterized membrane protein required for colicin V production
LINWADIVVILLILGFAVIGLLNGFIFSIFRIASFFISIFLAITFYPLLSGLLMKTPLYSSINASILKNLLHQQVQSLSTFPGNTSVADGIVNNMSIPGFLKETVKSNIPDFSKLIDVQKIMESVSAELTKMIIGVISLILLFILIRVGMIFAKFLLKGVAKLPVFKQINKVSGFFLGAFEGVLFVYIICAILAIFNTAAIFKDVFAQINNSVIAGYFYQHNFIIDIMFPK